MILVLDAYIAQDFWRLVYPNDRKLGKKGLVSAKSIADCEWAYSKDDVINMSPNWITEQFLSLSTGRVSSLVTESRFQRRSKIHCSRIWSSRIPAGSLYDLGNGVYASSPCFTFLQMASILHPIELIAYGTELCGCYSFDPSSERGMRERSQPLITTTQLQRYIDDAQGCRGFSSAKRALQYIVDGSASPMETIDEMLLCLPYRMGGYNLPKPAMNLSIPLDEHARRIAKRSKCYADMCFPKIHLDIEHHGKYDHSNKEDFDSDRARVNGLKAMGYEVIELTSKQVADVLTFEEIAVYIAKKLGKRMMSYGLGATSERLVLRDLLFDWNRRYGHAGKHSDSQRDTIAHESIVRTRAEA